MLPPPAAVSPGSGPDPLPCDPHTVAVRVSLNPPALMWSLPPPPLSTPPYPCHHTWRFSLHPPPFRFLLRSYPPPALSLLTCDFSSRILLLARSTVVFVSLVFLIFDPVLLLFSPPQYMIHHPALPPPPLPSLGLIRPLAPPHLLPPRPQPPISPIRTKMLAIE